MTPNYRTGERISVNDQVEIGNGLKATVVAIIDDDEYSDGFPREHWSQYKTGVLVISDEAGTLLYQRKDLIANFRKVP